MAQSTPMRDGRTCVQSTPASIRRSKHIGRTVIENATAELGSPPHLRHSEATQSTKASNSLLLQSDHAPAITEEESRPICWAIISILPHRMRKRMRNTHVTSDETNLPALSVAYGLINFAIALPVLMSFGSIIYRDEAFKPYQPVLVNLTVVSGVVHQLCFSTFSSLPFAVGQVQDAGLIFISGIASDLAAHCRRNGYDDAHMLATVTIGLGLCTFLLGFGLVIIGKCGLARYVQSLPTPVVGGYLAFIGWFCGQSGLGLMAGVEVTSISQWYKFFSMTKLLRLLPGLVGGVMIYTLVRKVKHMAVLPLCIVTMLVLFHVLLACTGTSVLDATNAGWITKADSPPMWYKTWDYLRPTKVVWSALPSQTLSLLSMTSVVALSSSLDVAAIELELNRPLDYNHELKTVGISNVVSGLMGGYTGSYIFSPTIFSLRAGIRSRLSGCVLALAELVSVLVPVPILSYVPNFFFGSLLVMICIDLMYEWLWDVRSKLTKAEYGIALGTFGLIQVVGVEYGIIGGVAVSFACAKIGFDMGKSTGDAVDGEQVKPCMPC